MSATERPAPPAETTDGTLTFKMPQATTAPPEPGEEEGRGALKILDDYFGGATFDSAIFGTDDGGPIDEAREKLQKSWDCLRSLILAPATAAVGVTREQIDQWARHFPGSHCVALATLQSILVNDLGITVLDGEGEKK